MNERKQVVIIGGGFAGLAAAQALRRSPVDVTLIDKRNFHLFQPLLYQVATGGLSPADIASPLRGILSRQINARVIQGTVTNITRTNKRCWSTDSLSCSTSCLSPRDRVTITLAMTSGRRMLQGSRPWRTHSTYDGECCPRSSVPKSRKILSVGKRCLTFVVVGGGPTGVELAGAW